MTAKEQYDIAHKSSKVIVFFMVVLLVLLGRHFNIIYLDIAAVVVWFFGVNLVAYLLESVLHFKHRHKLL